MTLEEHRVDVPDVPLPVFCIGSPEDPMILLLHGAGGDHTHFEGLLPVLTIAGFCVVTCDLCADGSVRVDFEILRSHLLAILAFYKPRRLVVGGLSMGGMLAQTLLHDAHCHYPVLAFVGLGSPTTDLVWPRMDWMDSHRDNELESDATVVRQGILASAMTEHGQRETARALARVSDRTLLDCLRACARSLPPIPSPVPAQPVFRRPRLGLPHLLICGAADIYTLDVMHIWKEQNAQEGIPTEVHPIPGAGHMVPLDAPDAVAKRMVAFIRALL